MLRKDVKLGLAIGGILLAVVVVYVLVVPGDRKTVSVVTDDGQNKTSDVTTPNPADATPEIASPSNAPPAVPPKTDADQGPTTAPSADNSSASPAGPAAPADTANGTATDTATGTADSTPKNTGTTDWNKLLNDGSSSPTMMTQTPTVASKSDNAADVAAPAAGDATPADSATAQPLAAGNPADQASAAAAAAADTATAANPPVDADKSASGLVAENAAPTTTQPSASAERTHVVQPGEMLTSIAAAAYGDSRKWKQIADANPNVDPDRMKPGTKLVIPVLAAYTQPGSHQTAASTAAIDTRTQYRVQPNDSLYRISLKLYGKADHVDQLYSDNKDVIGADPRRLKLDMILKLSDPPTAGVSQ